MPETPTEYYTSRYSGEEIDRGIDGALQLGGATSKQQALRAIGGRPNRNLLDNWYFVGGGSQQGGGQFPINQRGQTSYTNVNSVMYGIDMWILDWNTTLTLASGYASMTGNGIFQALPSEKISLITGKTVTLSALDVSGNLHVVTGVYDENTSPPGNGTIMLLKNYGGKSAVLRIISSGIVAAKLELGDHQTLAYQDEDGNWQLFETPDYGEELAKCRYYFRRYGVSSLGQIYLPPALGVSGTEANFSIVSEPMRIAPTISGNGFILAGTIGDGFIVDGSASFSLLGASPLSGIITVKVTCSNRTLVPGNYYTLYAKQEYGAFLDLSAEL